MVLDQAEIKEHDSGKVTPLRKGCLCTAHGQVIKIIFFWKHLIPLRNKTHFKVNL